MLHEKRRGEVACRMPRDSIEVPLAESRAQRNSLQGPYVLGLCLFLAVAIFFLWEEHRAHLFGVLPYALLLLCPFIHLFMHRGHRDHKTTAGDHGNHGHRLQEGRQP